MTKEEWIKIYNAKDGIWDKDDLIDKAYEIITSPIKTNYDRIRNMSVDDMAKFMAKLDDCEKYCAFTKDEKCNATGTAPFVCVKGCKQWLLQEVSENE